MCISSHFQTNFSRLLVKNFSDLSRFVQFTQDQTHLFLNGNVYNCKPEDLLSNFLKKGNDSLKTIDGDFLIIIVVENKILILRDRHGSGKQLLYSYDHLSSQLIDFKSNKNFDFRPDFEALFTFLSIGYIPPPMTSIEGIRKLPGGCLLTYENFKTSTLDLFDYNDFINSAGTSGLTLEEAAIEYERLHTLSIANRIANKNKVGLLLSGGYDSGGNISALRNIYDGSIVSYSVGFKDNPWSELPLAKILSERYQSTHYEYEIVGSEIMDLPVIIKALGDPFQENGLMLNYSAMQLVKNTGESPQIILGGDGNDQHFGTSGKELALHWKFKKNGIQIFQKLFNTIGNSTLFEKDNIYFRAQFQNRKILHIQQSDTFGFTKYQLNKLNVLNYKVPEYRYLRDSPKKYDNFDHFFFCRNFNIDIKQVINEVILFKASKIADLFSNPISFPYMSTELYDFLKKMPVDYKFHGTLQELSKGLGKSKFLHKLCIKPKLPTEITNRKKQGGFVPLPIFLKDSNQRKIIFEVISKSDAISAMFDKQKINLFLQQYNDNTNSPTYWFWYQQIQANQIINLLTLVVWWEIFINGKEFKSIYDLC